MASKRRLVHHDSGPLTKKFKQEDYLSKLPTELLLKIFANFKKDDGNIKVLTQTCSRFNDILRSQFALRLDFNRIVREGYPDIQREYSYIRIVGSEIDPNRKKIRNVLESSISSKKIISIGESDKKTKIKLQTFFFLLKMPNVILLNVQNVKVLAPQLKLEAILEHDYPRMIQLNSLILRDNRGPILSAFKYKTDLKCLIVLNSRVTNQMRSFIAAQKGLTWLRTYQYIELKAGALPQLKIFDFDTDIHQVADKKIFDFAPDLEVVNLLGSAGHSHAALLISNASSSIKTIKIDEATMPKAFTVDSILRNYPSMIEFKSRNVNWCK